MSYVTRQEMFDSHAQLAATDVLIINAFDALWDKHMATIKTDGFTPEYYADVKKLAEEFDVNFLEPKFKGGLALLPESKTVH